MIFSLVFSSMACISSQRFVVVNVDAPCMVVRSVVETVVPSKVVRSVEAEEVVGALVTGWPVGVDCNIVEPVVTVVPGEIEVVVKTVGRIVVSTM